MLSRRLKNPLYSRFRPIILPDAYSYEELKSAIEQYVKYYNEYGIKEKLGWMSSVQYRLKLLVHRNSETVGGRLIYLTSV